MIYPPNLVLASGSFIPSIPQIARDLESDGPVIRFIRFYIFRTHRVMA